MSSQNTWWPALPMAQTPPPIQITRQIQALNCVQPFIIKINFNFSFQFRRAHQQLNRFAINEINFCKNRGLWTACCSFKKKIIHHFFLLVANGVQSEHNCWSSGISLSQSSSYNKLNTIESYLHHLPFHLLRFCRRFSRYRTLNAIMRARARVQQRRLFSVHWSLQNIIVGHTLIFMLIMVYYGSTKCFCIGMYLCMYELSVLWLQKSSSSSSFAVLMARLTSIRGTSYVAMWFTNVSAYAITLAFNCVSFPSNWQMP